ncbi:hypothetical protein OCU04_011184 [Sclerotinia nivalis]|uniref:Uncharacterized protein n=1 Tax=Sclerotinia nivalis TaxID=352851 RepID=A0A9X0AB08_9HELO|nr:hypothetical protein OCU04_011184 [Sclerotinia nivalis]
MLFFSPLSIVFPFSFLTPSSSPSSIPSSIPSSTSSSTPSCTPSSTSNLLIMCQSTSVNYSCEHRAPRKITYRCLWAQEEDVKTGCYDVSPAEGVEHLDNMCESCNIKANLKSTSTFTHVGIDGIRRPLTRDSIAASRLEGTMEKLNEAEAKSLKEVLTKYDEKVKKRRKEIARANRERIREQDPEERREEWTKKCQELDAWLDGILEKQRRIHEIKKGKLKGLYGSFGDFLGGETGRDGS